MNELYVQITHFFFIVLYRYIVDVLGDATQYPLKIRTMVTQIMNLTMLENKFLWHF